MPGRCAAVPGARKVVVMAKRRDPDQPVVLSRIYTKTGDDGTTNLGDMSRTDKTDRRLTAYADVEEANAAIGAALGLGDLPKDIAALLLRVQNDLFDVGADLSAPLAEDSEVPALRVPESYIEGLEADCDRYNADLEPLRSFILPGGTPAAALLHLARTVVRRAERSAWWALEEHGERMSVLPAKYLNRLSDLLFILCRVANAEHGDVLWKPGASR